MPATKPRRKPKETVQEFIDRYHYDFARTTRDGRERWENPAFMLSALRPWAREFGSMKLTDFARLTAEDLRPFMQTIPTDYAVRMRTAMNDAETYGLIIRNPLRGIRLQTNGNKPIDVLSEDELTRLMEVASPMIAAMVASAGYSGLRPGEVFALRPVHVDLELGEIHVEQTWNGRRMKPPKNGKERLVVLPPPAIEWHERWMDERDEKSRYYFEGRDGHFTSASFMRWWHPVREEFGRPDLLFRSLRHTAATLMLERGLSVSDVAAQLGHSDGGQLVQLVYGEPHREHAARLDRIRAAFRE